MIPQEEVRGKTPDIMEKYARRNPGKALVIAAVALVNIAAFARMGPAYELGLGALLVIALAMRAWGQIHFMLLFFLMSMMRDMLPGVAGNMPSVKALGPLVISTLLILPFRKKAAIGWMRAGKADRTAVTIGLTTCAVSVIALVIWADWTRDPGAGPAMVRFFAARFPKWAIIAFGAPLFALVNAFSEESVYRGLSLATIGAAFGPGIGAVLQASLYAAAHFRSGFPNGYAGYAMTFVYGCVLGYLRLRTGGLKGPYFMHIIADLTIGYLMVFKFL